MINLNSVKSLLITLFLCSCVVALSYAQNVPTRSQHFQAKESISTYKELKGKTLIKPFNFELREGYMFFGVTSLWFIDGTTYEVGPNKFVAYLDSNEFNYYKVEVLKDATGTIKSVSLFTAKDIFITYK